MARRPNYGLQRSEVNRAKQAKNEAKQREREEAVARRKAAREGKDLPEDANADDLAAEDLATDGHPGDDLAAADGKPQPG